MTIRRGKRKGEATAKLGDKNPPPVGTARQGKGIDLQDAGAHRATQRRVGFNQRGATGARRSLPYLVLDAADEKNRQGSTIPLRTDLAADLRQWLADKAKAAQDTAEARAVRFDPKHQIRHGRNQGDATGPEGQSCLPLPTVPTLPPDTPIFTVPAGLVRILDRDLVAAGIAKRDERGRTVDVHAMRHTFGTLLSKGGVSPRTARPRCGTRPST